MIRFKRQLTIRETKVRGILAAMLPTSRITTHDYGSFMELTVNGRVYSIDCVLKRFYTYDGLVIVSQSYSFFKAVYDLGTALQEYFIND